MAVRPDRLAVQKCGRGQAPLGRIEIARARCLRDVGGPVMNSPEAAAQFVIDRWFCGGPVGHEIFVALYMNSRRKVLAATQIARGGQTGVIVDVRKTLVGALLVGATGLFVAHNHPGGDVQPSAADFRLTERIIREAKPLTLKVFDHLVIVPGGSPMIFWSMREHDNPQGLGGYDEGRKNICLPSTR